MTDPAKLCSTLGAEGGRRTTCMGTNWRSFALMALLHGLQWPSLVRKKIRFTFSICLRNRYDAYFFYETLDL